jgi:PIN domain nuclease of toxin-antitoxin system
MAASLITEVHDFDQQQARITGDLIFKTREFGLSFGDRACLALGIALGVPVCTTDRAWERLNLGIEIHLIR